MKKTLLSLTTIIWSSLLFAQNYDSPAVEWRVAECPHKYPTSPVFEPLSSDPMVQPQPGDNVRDYSIEYPFSKSGEDWWYSITPAIVGGVEIGYYVSGFSTFLNYNHVEDGSGGCKENLAKPIDPEINDIELQLRQPILGWNGEKLSTKLAAVSLYNKKGEMVWCKPQFFASEGAFNIKADNDGYTYVTGWTNTTIDIHGNPTPYNPTSTTAGLALTGTVCDANETKMIVGKISPTGNLVWANVYGMYDIGLSGYTNEDIVSIESVGIDLVIDNNGDIVIAGHTTSEISTNEAVFLVKLNEDGEIIKKTETSILNFHINVRSISMYDDDYLVTGFAYGVSGTNPNDLKHGITLKFDSNLEPYSNTTFGFNTKSGVFSDDGSSFSSVSIGTIWHENIYDPPGANNHNYDFDAKQLANDNIAIVSLEDCNIGNFSGANFGVGFLRIYEPDGSGLDATAHPTSEPIRINTTSGLDYPYSGYITAFDLKIGLEPTDGNEITLITSVKDGDINSIENTPIFAQSMEVISNPLNPSTTPADFFDVGVYRPRGSMTEFYPDVTQTSALIANYDINGVLRWEKIIDAHDEPLQVYPGDWKEQECVYQVMKDEDGAYVYVGNSSDNKDDYYIGKIYSNCQLDIAYDVEPADPVANNIIEYNTGGYVNWNPTFWGTSDIYVRGEIHVKSGTTLQITSGLIVHFADGSQMDYDTKLVIEPGARLIVNNATLTSTECPNAMWRGIEVWGNTSLSQQGSNQGAVTLTSATIEHANEAIQLWKPYDWTSTGGIVRATNSTFLNNNRSVQFLAYENIVSGNVVNNQSYFTNCSFSVDDDFKRDKFYAHGSLYKVRGVRFTGCDFGDDRAGLTYAKMSNGLVSIDANYSVKGRVTGTITTPHDYYYDTNYDVGTFTNLLTGIEVMNANSQNTVTVDHNLFTNCKTGVRLSKVDNAIITRNKFERITGGVNTTRYGVYLDQCTDYQVEGNEITSPHLPAQGYYGIYVKNSGFDNNEVYKNKVNNTSYAAIASAKNRDDNPDPIVGDGLEFLCNDYVDTKITDEYVLGSGSLDGIRLFQGTTNNPARNVFSETTSVSGYNIGNYTADELYYHYYTGDPDQEPVDVNGGVTKIESPNNVVCPTNFTDYTVGDGGVFVSNMKKISLDSLHWAVDSEYQIKYTTLMGLLEQANRLSLYTLVDNMTPADSADVLDSLLAEGSYLSTELLLEVATKIPDTISNEAMRELLIINPDALRSKGFLTAVRAYIPGTLYTELQHYLDDISPQTEKWMELADLDKEKTRIARWMIRDVFADTTEFSWDAYTDWTSARNAFQKDLQLIDAYLSFGEKDSSEALFSAVSALAIAEPSLAGVLGDYLDFKELMLDSTNADGTLEGVTDSLAPILRNFADNASGPAQIQAQNLLCFFLGECTELDTIAEPRNMLVDNTGERETNPLIVAYKNKHNVYPNPNSGIFTVDVADLEVDEIVVLDLNGRIVRRLTLNNTNTVQVDARDLNAGIYFIQLLSNSSVVESSKVIKQ